MVIAQPETAALETPPLDLQRVLSQVADGLIAAVSADNCLIYWVTPNQTFSPLLVSGLMLESDRNRVLSTPLDPATDLLAREVLQRRVSLVSNRVHGDARMTPSILQALGCDTAIAIPVTSANKLIALVLVTRQGRYEPFTVIQIRVAEAISVAISLALENDRLYRRTRSSLEEMRRLHQVTLALLQKLELEEVLEIVCSEAQRLVGAQGSSIALLESEEWLKIMYTTGKSPDLPGRIPVDQSTLGLAIRKGEPVVINNPGDGGGTASGAPLTILATPLIVQGTVIGGLDMVNKEHGFSQDDVRLIQLFANEAAIAVENARLARRVQEMAVVEERYRLSRELHDSVNQLLYGITLYTKAAQKQLAQGDLVSVRGHLDQLQSSAQDALNEMRLLIFDLRPKMLEQLGLQEALSQRLKSVEERLGLQSSFKWRVKAVLDAKMEEALYGIAQEALNNVIKHSHARNVVVHLVQSGQTLIMKIEDDGIGFDPSGVEEGRIGLKTMQERAVALNASLEIQSIPGSGTSIIVEVRI